MVQWRPRKSLLIASPPEPLSRGAIPLQTPENTMPAQPRGSGCGSPYLCIFLPFASPITEGKPVFWGQELTSCV